MVIVLKWAMGVFDHLKRKANARRFGVEFKRRADFLEVPSTITIGKDRVALAHPEDHGALADFMACFIEDEYGLAGMRGVETVLDIGANAGYFSLAARSYFPNATIHAYEPNPRVQTYLASNSQAGGFEVFHEAVGASDGAVHMIDAADSNLATTEPGGSIPQVAFLTAVERLGQVDLLKLDCEGAEWSILEGQGWDRVKDLRMEYHLVDGHTLPELMRLLDRVNMRIVKHEPHGEFGMIWAKASR